MSTLKFRVELDGAAETAAGFDKVAAAGKNAVNQVAAGSRQLDQYGQSARATAAALRQVPAQFTDIVTGLASGQNPLTVLLQQGGQLKDMFGGVGNAARALGGYVAGLVNPFSVAAAAAVGLAVAYEKAQEESRNFERALINTGNAAATSANELRDMAGRVAEATGGTRGAAAEALTEMAASGNVAAEMLEKVSAVAVGLERVGGAAIAETAEQFAALGRDPVEALKKLDQQSHFLTATVLEQVQALVEQGRSAEAAQVAQTAWADALAQRIPQLEEQLNVFQLAWRGLAKAAGDAWAAMQGAFTEATTAEKLRAAQERVAAGDTSARGDVAVWQAKLDAEKQGLAAQAAANIQRRAELGWLKEGEQYRSKQQRMEAEIAKAREVGAQARKSDLEIEARIGQIREKYAEKTRSGGGARAPRADPLDAELERLRMGLRAADSGLSGSTVKALDNLAEALRRGKIEAAEYGQLLDSVLGRDPALKGARGGNERLAAQSEEFLAREERNRERALASFQMLKTHTAESAAAMQAYLATIDRGEGILRHYEQQVTAARDAHALLSREFERQGPLNEAQIAALDAQARAAEDAAAAYEQMTAAVEAQAEANGQATFAMAAQAEQVRRLEDATQASAAIMGAMLDARTTSGYYTTLESMRAEGNINRERIAQLAELKSAYEAMGEAGVAAAAQVEAEMIRLSARLDPIADQVRHIFEEAFTNFFDDILGVINGEKKLKDALKSLGNSILKELWSMGSKELSQQLMKLLGGGLEPGKGAGLFSLISQAFVPDSRNIGADIVEKGRSVFNRIAGGGASISSGFGSARGALFSIPMSARGDGISEAVSEFKDSLGSVAAQLQSLGSASAASQAGFSALNTGVSACQSSVATLGISAATSDASIASLGVSSALADQSILGTKASSILADVALASTAASATAASAGLSSVAVASSSSAVAGATGGVLSSVVDSFADSLFQLGGLGFRNGGAFGPSGPIHAFAAGGIVSTPTLFRFANGGASARGLMGEAGPEAILPLARDSAGRLGVRSDGSGGSPITIHLHGIAGNADDLRRSAGQIGRQVSGAIIGARRYG